MSTYSDDYVKTLQAEIARKDAEKEAILSEFRTAISSNAEWSPEDLKTRFNVLLERAYDRMVTLLDNADSEAVQFSICKFIFSVGFGTVKVTDENVPDKELKDLLAALSK